MSKQENAIEWFANNSLIGFTEARGNFWHWREGNDNHFPGAIPADRIIAMLNKATAIERPVFITDENGNPFKDATRKAIYIPHFKNVAHIAKDGFQIHQFTETLYNRVHKATNGECGVASVVLLDNGARACVQIERPENFEAAGFKFRPGIVSATAVDGSMKTTDKDTLVGVGCDNTLAWALNGSGASVTVKHTRYSLDRLSEGGDAYKALLDIAKAAGYNINKAADKLVTEAQFQAFLAQLVPMPPKKDEGSERARTVATNKRNDIARLYTSDPRCKPWHGTALGVMQATNTYQNHEATVRNANRYERNVDNILNGKLEISDAFAWSTLNKVLVAA